MARLAQSVERKALDLVVVGSSPTVDVFCDAFCCKIMAPSDVIIGLHIKFKLEVLPAMVRFSSLENPLCQMELCELAGEALQCMVTDAQRTHWDLNPGPSACEADVIPLHHVPHAAMIFREMSGMVGIVTNCAQIYMASHARRASESRVWSLPCPGEKSEIRAHRLYKPSVKSCSLRKPFELASEHFLAAPSLSPLPPISMLKEDTLVES